MAIELTERAAQEIKTIIGDLFFSLILSRLMFLTIVMKNASGLRTCFNCSLRCQTLEKAS